METAAGLYKGLLFPDGGDERPHLTGALERAALDASVDCIKIISPHGMLVHMNKAGCLALGVPRDSRFGMPWLPLLDESVHETGNEALALARQGQNARFAGQSGDGDERRYWDNLLTPIPDAHGTVRFVLCVSRDVTAKTLLERELAHSIERERLLAREMRHRVKNLFSMVSGLITLSEKEASGGDSPGDVLDILRGKLGALARASDVTFGQVSPGSPDHAAVDFASLVLSVMEPYAGRFEIDGGKVGIDNRIMTTVALLLHELATNAVKYGAFSVDGGRVSISWNTEDSNLRIVWRERGGPALQNASTSHGFGRTMIERMVRSAGGSWETDWLPEGISVVIVLPAPV